MKGKKYPAPFATAIVAAAGFARGMEPIHVGILVEASVGISLISPPVGVCL